MNAMNRREMVAICAGGILSPKIVAASSDDFSTDVAGYWSADVVSSSETRIRFVPSRANIRDNLPELLSKHEHTRHLVVEVPFPISPIGPASPHAASMIELFERHGVDEVIETSNRGPFRTPPLRVGQIDPTGIVYVGIAP